MGSFNKTFDNSLKISLPHLNDLEFPFDSRTPLKKVREKYKNSKKMMLKIDELEDFINIELDKLDNETIKIQEIIISFYKAKAVLLMNNFNKGIKDLEKL